MTEESAAIDTTLMIQPPREALGVRTEHAYPTDSEVPRALVNQVAASLKSLARVMPYEEYAPLVHRIAELKWRCSRSKGDEVSP